MKPSTWIRVLAGLLVLTLIAASCGSDSDGGDGSDASASEDTSASTDTSSSADADDTDDVADTAADDAADTAEPIKIGMLTSFTGPFTPWGVQAAAGMHLAADEINAAGGVDGRMIELVETDDENSAEAAAIGFDRMVEGRVVAVAGTISSGVAVPTAILAEEAEMPYLLVKAGSDAILTRDSRYTFRTCIPAAPSVPEPIVQYAQAEGLSKIGVIIADYAWGRAMESALQTSLDQVDGLEYQIEVAPVPEQDFTTYLRNLEAFGPELIVATGHPPGSGAITAQSNDLGMDVQVTGAYTPFSLIAGGVGDAAIGVYSDFSCADYESDDYQDLARRFLAATDYAFMEADAVQGFGIVTMIASAVEAVGDDPAAIAAWLHTQSFDLPGYAFTLDWTEWGEMAHAAPIFAVLGAGPAPDGVNEAGDWYPEILIRPEPLTPYEPS